jgi:hypothetical protein
MTGTPTQDPESRDNVPCPRCAVLIPDNLEVCPFCRQPMAAKERDAGPRDIRERLVKPELFPALRKLYRKYGKWLKIALPILVGVPALWFLFSMAAKLSVTIPGNTTLPIEVVQVKKGGRTVLLKGELTNLGEDVPDLSLRSIGVTAEFRMDDGREESKRVFPKSPFRGEGALFHGESGAFEIEVPKGAKGVTLRAEIVNLGAGSPFGFTDRGSRRLPKKGRR